MQVTEMSSSNSLCIWKFILQVYWKYIWKYIFIIDWSKIQQVKFLRDIQLNIYTYDLGLSLKTN